MKRTMLAAALLAATSLTAPAHAQTVLRLDEVPVGELDPAKASDYADSILMFNVYDTLVLPAQGGPGQQPHLAESWEIDGATYTFTLRDDVTFQSGNPLTAADVVYSLERMQALGQGLSYLFGGVTAEAVDDRTVRFTLDAPYAPFVASLVRLPIVDSALVAENATADDEWAEAFPVGHRRRDRGLYGRLARSAERNGHGEGRVLFPGPAGGRSRPGADALRSRGGDGAHPDCAGRT